MLTHIIPKLPMRNRNITLDYYSLLGFNIVGGEYHDYLMLEKDGLQIHFFKFSNLDPKENYGQIYIRCSDIERLCSELIENNIEIHPNGTLAAKPWGQKEFSLLDPDNNLITFGEKD